MPQNTAEHFFPRPDADLLPWGDRFNAYVQVNFAAVGLSAAEAIGLNAKWFRFHVDYLAHVQARAAATAAYQRKAHSRREFEALLRPAVRRIQTFAATTDAQRGLLGITIPDRSRTPSAAPTTRPVLVKVDFSKRLVHRIAFVDQRTPTRRTKPKGILGAELWVKLTTVGEAPPTGPADLKFLLLATRSPAKVEYSGDQAGHTAHYMVRWLSRRGEPGPWSETATATIGA